MNYWGIVSCSLLGMGIVFLMVPLLLRTAMASSAYSRGQDLHHTHQKPVPRLGGLALAAAFIGVEILIAAVWPEQRVKTSGRLVVLVSSLAMFALGFWDDWKPLGAKRKLCEIVLGESARRTIRWSGAIRRDASPSFSA